MKTKITLFLTTIFVVMSFSSVVFGKSSEKNVATQTNVNNNPPWVNIQASPARLIAGSRGNNVKFTVSNPSLRPHILQVRLLRRDGSVVEQRVVRGSIHGRIQHLMYFSIPSSEESGKAYRWHVQMWSTDWKNMITQAYKNQVEVIGTVRNTISIYTHPQIFYASTNARFESMKVFYTKSNRENVFLQARLLSKSGKIVVENTIRAYTTNTYGSHTFRLRIPANIPVGNDYKWNVQMYDVSWKNKLATITRSGIKVIRTSNLTAELNSFEEKGFNDLSVFPNPFINSFEYEYSVENEDAVTVDLYALDGRKIENIKNAELHKAGNYSDQVDTGNLAAGIYILSVSTSEDEKTMKLIKN